MLITFYIDNIIKRTHYIDNVIKRTNDMSNDTLSKRKMLKDITYITDVKNFSYIFVVKHEE